MTSAGSAETSRYREYARRALKKPLFSPLTCGNQHVSDASMLHLVE